MYKIGDKIKADDINSLMSLLGDGLSTRTFVQAGEVVERPELQVFSDVIVEPLELMPPYSAFMIDDEAVYDATYTRPRFKVRSYGHTRNGTGPYFTNGPVEIAAGEFGWAKPMVQGEFYWIQATDDVIGVCGIGDTDTKLITGMPGFLAGGFATIDGLKCGSVTPYYNGLIFAVNQGGVSAGSVGDFRVYKSGGAGKLGQAGPMTLTNVIYKAWNPSSFNNISNGTKAMLFPVCGFYIAVEIC